MGQRHTGAGEPTAPTRVERSLPRARSTPREPRASGGEAKRAAANRSASPMDLVPGAVLSNYRIERQIGAGEGGRVFVAHDRRLERRVVLEVVDANDAAGCAALLRRAQVAAALEHPRIAPVYAVEEAEGRVILVTPHAPLGTLDLRTEPLAPAERVAIALDLVAALAHAHAHGVVHGDLDPRHVVRTAEGRVRLGGLGSSSRPEAPYAAPELLTPGTVATPASDVYSLAVIVAEVLGGMPSGSLARDPSPASLRRALGRSWVAARAVLERAIASDPALRPPDARALERMLVPALATRTRRATLAVAALVLGLAAAGFAWHGGSAQVAAPPLVRVHRITRQGSDDPLAALAVDPAASRVLAATTRGQVVRVAELDAIEARVEVDADRFGGRVIDVAWAGPAMLVTVRRAEEPSPVVVRVSPGANVELVGRGSHAAASRDGAVIAWIGEERLEVRDRSGAVRALAPVWRGSTLIRPPLSLSPDGRWVAFVRSDEATRLTSLRAVPVAGGEERSLLPEYAGYAFDARHSVQWIDGAILTTEVASSISDQSQGTHLVRIRVSTEGPRLDVLDIERSPRIEGVLSRLCASPDGRRAVFLRSSVRHGVTTAAITRTPDGRASFGAPQRVGTSAGERFSAFDHDGHVLSTRLGTELPFELVVRDPASGRELALPPAARGRSLMWAVPDPSGSGIVAWESVGSDRWRAVRIAPDASAPRSTELEVRVAARAAGIPPGWRRLQCAGARCLHAELREARIELRDALGTSAGELHESSGLETHPYAWDLDAAGRVAYAGAARDGGVSIVADGAEIGRIPGHECRGAIAIAWDPPSAVLVSTEDACDGLHRIERVTVDGSREVVWGPAAERPIYLGVSPDGRWLGLTTAELESDVFAAELAW